jgi:hypothetical protein
MRYECGEPYADAFVEVDELWTRGEMRSYFEKGNLDFVGTFAKHVTGVYLPVGEGEPISTAAQFTDDNLDRVYMPVYTWLTGVIAMVPADLGKLGEALRRPLFASLEPTKATMGGEEESPTPL